MNTSSLILAGDEVIEIGAMKIFGSEIDEQKTFHSLVNPKRMISEEASRVNGITNEMVASAPTLDEIFPQFLDFLGSAWLVAQNAKFDMGFLMKYLMKFNQKKTLEVYDTVHFSRRCFPEESRHNLDVICQRLQMPVDALARHRSMEDVRLTARVFVALKERLGENCPPREKYSI